MLRYLFAVLSLALVINPAKAQTVFSDDLKNNIKARIDNGTHPGIVIAIIDKDGPHYYSAGVRSVKTKEPVNEHSVFEIGSISKTFTGILLAEKVLKKEMALTDPVQQYLPSGVTAPTRNGASITLVELSNHTSGLPRMPNNFKPANPNNPFADYTEKQLYDFLTAFTLTRDIGATYEYSNVAAGLLGHILAAKSGVSYEQLMIDGIAKPLSMNDTRIVFTPSMKKNLAMGHAGGSEVENWDLPTLAGAGAIRSTATDMAKYISANMGLTKSTIYPALQLSHKNTRTAGATPMVGLGWHIQPAGSDEIIWHNGGTGGYRSFAGFIPGKIGVVVLVNSSEGADDIGFHILNPSSPLKTIETEIKVDPKILESYVGSYELAPGFILTITHDAGQLKAQATGQPQFPVYAKSENVFFFKVVEAQLTFNKNAEGIIESVTLKQNGQQITGKKK